MPSRCVTPQRLGDPRVVPCFRWLFSVGMSPSETPGSRSGACTQFLHRPRWPSTFWDGLGTSFTLHPPILVEESISGLNYGSLALRPADLLAPLSEQTTLSPQPTGTFTSGLSADWSPAPPPDITTVATGQVPLAGLPTLHPLEHQLASLQPRTGLRAHVVGSPPWPITSESLVIRPESVSSYRAPIIFRLPESAVTILVFRGSAAPEVPMS